MGIIGFAVLYMEIFWVVLYTGIIGLAVLHMVTIGCAVLYMRIIWFADLDMRICGNVFL